MSLKIEGHANAHRPKAILFSISSVSAQRRADLGRLSLHAKKRTHTHPILGAVISIKLWTKLGEELFPV